MTTGQLVFYSGIALLALTIITAIVFLIKKPKYVPENAAYGSVRADNTRRLRNGYPTERQTIRRSGSIAETELVDGAEAETEILPLTEKIDP